MDQATAIEGFAALAQETRMAIYRLLVRTGPDGMMASDIARALDVVPSTLSGHLAVLRRAGLLTATRRAREIHYAADLARVNALVGFLLADCCGGQVDNCREILSLLKP
jgi:DNA-binding transcriptional ArsR family regulator